MSTILATVTSVVSSAGHWVQNYLGMIQEDSTGILMLGIVLSFAGFGIGVIKRLMSL